MPNERHEQFVGLLTASHDKLLGYLLSLLGRWHDAQDVLQRASLLMWQKFGSFESEHRLHGMGEHHLLLRGKILPAHGVTLAFAFR